jgi:glycosyltransferase involved in cell wall biosynthesis
VLWVFKELALGGAERLLLEIQPHLEEIEFIPVAVTAGDRSLEPLLRSAGFSPTVLESRHQADLRWMGRLRRIVRGHRPDLVHLHNPYPAAGGRLALLGTDVPVVYTEHSVWPRYHLWSRWANALTLSLSDRIIAVSDAVRASMLRSPLGRRSQRKIEVIPNGINIDRVISDAQSENRPSTQPTYGCIGHLRSAKGIDVFLQAARTIQDAIPGAQGIVVGDGEDRDALMAQQATLGADSVSFVGVRQDAREILAGLDVFVIASRYEGLPLALLEAMSLERPIVATKVGAIPDVLTDRRDALLVAPEDPLALAAAVERLLTDRKLATRLGRSAADTVRARFGADTTARGYERIYREVTA